MLTQLLFSGRTYQAEIDDFWVFLQLEKGLATDLFCSCGEEMCSHMQEALALLQAERPLHERFEESFFKKVFLDLKEGGGEFVEEKPGVFASPSCRIETKDLLLQKLLRDPPRENETNSIKFSDRSLVEIEK